MFSGGRCEFRRPPESQWFVMARLQGCYAEIEETTLGLLSRFAGRTRAEIRHNSFERTTLHRFGLLFAALLLACNVLAAQEQTSPGKLSSLLITGRVLAETGQPSPDPVSLSLFCEGRPFKAVHTGTQGYFEITFAPGSDDADADLSASDTVSPASGSFSFQGISRGFHADGGSNVSLTGCELRVSAVNYQPITHTLSGPVDFGRLDVGTLQLTRLVHVNGSVVDVNSLLVPESARKEFDRGEKDARGNRLEPAIQHMKKAVAVDVKYAAAWSELGNFYGRSAQTDQARQSFQKAIAADPDCVPAYVGLANVQLQTSQDESAVETAGKALELDSANGFAKLIQAMGDFNLHRLDAAEKTARELETGTHSGVPQLHALLAEIYLQQRNPSTAAVEIQTYLKESPQGEFAPQMRADLQQLEASSPDPLAEVGPPAR
jgi:tetratricopeptide (TPR) repeat protein